MNHDDPPKPIDIRLLQKSKILEIDFDNGRHFTLSCEYLRVYSPSAEDRGHTPEQKVLQYGKKHVNITGIDPIGNYGVRLVFDDGHQTGIYTWETLYDLGSNQSEYWQQYIQELAQAGRDRE